jgi:hypothetical protein
MAAYQVGDETYFVGMVVDITARHETALALERSQRTLEARPCEHERCGLHLGPTGFVSSSSMKRCDVPQVREQGGLCPDPRRVPCVSRGAGRPMGASPRRARAVPRALRGERVNNAEYHLLRTDTGEAWVGSYSFGPNPRRGRRNRRFGRWLGVTSPSPSAPSKRCGPARRVPASCPSTVAT